MLYVPTTLAGLILIIRSSWDSSHGKGQWPIVPAKNQRFVSTFSIPTTPQDLASPQNPAGSLVKGFRVQARTSNGPTIKWPKSPWPFKPTDQATEGLTDTVTHGIGYSSQEADRRLPSASVFGWNEPQIFGFQPLDHSNFRLPDTGDWRFSIFFFSIF